MKPREFVEEYSVKSLVCCFSGGKDSLVATHYVMSELQNVDIEKHVAYVDTGVMLPITTSYVKNVCNQFHWRLTILYGQFFEKAQKWGVPTMHRRWCCNECKLKHIRSFVSKLAPQRGEVLGLWLKESKRREKNWDAKYVVYDKKASSWLYNPLLFWNKKDIFSYIKNHDLPMPPHYKLGLKETCQCGAFSSRKEIMILKAHFPELFQKFVELETKFKPGKTAFYFQNKPVYARDLVKQKTLTEKSGGV